MTARTKVPRSDRGLAITLGALSITAPAAGVSVVHAAWLVARGYAPGTPTPGRTLEGTGERRR